MSPEFCFAIEGSSKDTELTALIVLCLNSMPQENTFWGLVQGKLFLP